jgi:hypothetical protein
MKKKREMVRDARETETKALIDEAESASHDKDEADKALVASQEAATGAATVLAQKSQAVFDDLTANGVALYIETEDGGEPMYFVASPEHPNSYTLTPIRTA